MRQEADGVLVVDAGDTLCGPQVLPQQRARRAKLILDAYGKMGLDAMAIGERDTEAGVDLSSLPAVAIVDRAGVRVGVFSYDFGVEAPITPAPAPVAPPPTTLSPEQLASELSRRAAKLRSDGAQLVVALVHGGVARARAALQVAPLGVDFVVVSHSGTFTQLPEKVGGAWLVEAGSQAKQVGELDLHILDGKLTFQDVGMRGQLEASIANEEQAIVDVELRRKSAAPSLQAMYDQQLAQLRRTILEQKGRIGAQPLDAHASWIENKLVPLGTDLPDAPAVAALVKSYKDEIGKETVAQAAHGPSPSGPIAAGVTAAPPAVAATGSPATGPTPNVPPAPSDGYAGIQRCAPCHQQEVQFWQRTKHAHAWQTLVDKGQQNDPACFGCHVTGSLFSMHDVQCEACHGRGEKHLAAPSVKGLIVRDPAETQCTTCHRAPMAGEWDFPVFRKAIVGPGHGGGVHRP